MWIGQSQGDQCRGVFVNAGQTHVARVYVVMQIRHGHGQGAHDMQYLRSESPLRGNTSVQTGLRVHVAEKVEH